MSAAVESAMGRVIGPDGDGSRRWSAHVGTLITLTLCSLSLAALGIWVSATRPGMIDIAPLRSLHRFDGEHSVFVQAMRSVSNVFDVTGWFVVFAVVLLVLALRRQFAMAAFVAVVEVASPLTNVALKSVVARPRPTWSDPIATATGWSFPSGHTQAATAGVCLILVVMRIHLRTGVALWSARIGAVAVVGLVGLSRMALGVHYPSDIVAGVLAGLVVVMGVLTVWPVRFPRT